MITRFYIGSSIKYVTLEWRGPRRCDSLWQGEGSKSMWCHTLQIFSYMYMKPKIESNVWLSVVTDVLWQKWGRTKTTPNKTFQTKTPGQNPLDKTPANNWERFVHGVFARGFLLLKIGGPRCVTYFMGWQNVTGGSKLVKNRRTQLIYKDVPFKYWY